jgi:hypothetical protein
MGGRPVWLASVSKRATNGRIIPASKYPPRLERLALVELRRALRGVGDESRERCFAMCITLCLHRALSDDEIAALPASFHDAPALDVAGGPLRTIYTKGFDPPLSCQPCEHPTHAPLPAHGGAGLDARRACHESACSTAGVTPRKT